jgi:hypothetical protein
MKTLSATAFSALLADRSLWTCSQDIDPPVASVDDTARACFSGSAQLVATHEAVRICYTEGCLFTDTYDSIQVGIDDFAYVEGVCLTDARGQPLDDDEVYALLRDADWPTDIDYTHIMRELESTAVPDA